MELHNYPKQAPLTANEIKQTDKMDILQPLADNAGYIIIGVPSEVTDSMPEISSLLQCARSSSACIQYIQLFKNHQVQFPSISHMEPLIKTMELCKQGIRKTPVPVTSMERDILIRYFSDTQHLPLTNPAHGNHKIGLLDEIVCACPNISMTLCVLYMFQQENHNYLDLREIIKSLNLITRSNDIICNLYSCVSYEQLAHNIRIYTGGNSGLLRHVAFLATSLEKRIKIADADTLEQKDEDEGYGNVGDVERDHVYSVIVAKKGWLFVDDSSRDIDQSIAEYRKEVFIPALQTVQLVQTECRLLFLRFLFQPGKHHGLKEELLCIYWSPGAAPQEEAEIYAEKAELLRSKMGVRVLECTVSADFTYEEVVRRICDS